MHAQYDCDDLEALAADLKQDQVTLRYRVGRERKEVFTSISVPSPELRIVVRAFIEVTEHKYDGYGENDAATTIIIPLRDVIEVETESYELMGSDPADQSDYDFQAFSRWLRNKWHKLKRVALDQ